MLPHLPPNTNLSEAKSGILKTFLWSLGSAKVDQLEGELAVAHSKYEAEIRNKENDKVELTKAQAKLKMEDNSAAFTGNYFKRPQIVCRRHLSMKERHAAAVNTLTTQRSILSSQLDQSRANTGKLRLALDEAGGNVIRKIFGRQGDDANTLLENILRDAQGYSADLNGSSESMGQIVVAENAVETLVGELRLQTARRFELVMLLFIPAHQKNLPAPPASEETREDPDEVLHTATERLNDYAEDACVEPEIRMALMRGFETVPEALADKSGESPTLEEKAQQNLSQKFKLDDMLPSSRPGAAFAYTPISF
ncbi:hypothetical protein EDD85DRAFT_946350 [Armillaria nabsnona]|nr:hypothetical protein EDD85DRAFT_946350 [Armillaria nabsnona]